MERKDVMCEGASSILKITGRKCACIIIMECKAGRKFKKTGSGKIVF